MEVLIQDSLNRYTNTQGGTPTFVSEIGGEHSRLAVLFLHIFLWRADGHLSSSSRHVSVPRGRMPFFVKNIES